MLQFTPPSLGHLCQGQPRQHHQTCWQQQVSLLAAVTGVTSSSGAAAPAVRAHCTATCQAAC
jgi:hypothetical protein